MRPPLYEFVISLERIAHAEATVRLKWHVQRTRIYYTRLRQVGQSHIFCHLSINRYNPIRYATNHPHHPSYALIFKMLDWQVYKDSHNLLEWLEEEELSVGSRPYLFVGLLFFCALVVCLRCNFFPFSVKGAINARLASLQRG